MHSYYLNMLLYIHLMLSLYFPSLLLVLVSMHFHYMSDYPHLLSHYLNCMDLSSMLLSYSLLFHHSIYSSMYQKVGILHYMFMHLLHLLYYLLLLYLYVLVHLFHGFDLLHYMSLHLDYLVLLYLLY